MNTTETQSGSSLDPLVSGDWSLRLVAKWCEERAKQTADRRMLKRLWARYAKGSMKTPFERFAMAVQSEVDEKTEFWMHMAKTLRDEAANE